MLCGVMDRGYGCKLIENWKVCNIACRHANIRVTFIIVSSKGGGGRGEGERWCEWCG